MIVSAMLAWFDEPLDLLETAVSSCAVLADRVVCADGAYELVPDRKPESDPSQRKAIEKAAKRAGVTCEFMAPRLWEGQVKKRDSLLKAAARGSDWVFPLDADWRISGERDLIRVQMEHTKFDSLAVRFYQPENPERPTAEIAPHHWHLHNAGQTFRYPFLMRVFEDMRVEHDHWSYSGVKNGQRIGLWGGANHYPPASVTDLEAPHLFEHRCLFRDDKTLARNRDFCRRRDRIKEMTGIEA